jgi:hypothetical protein
MATNKPRDRPTVPEVLPLVRRIYERHCAGCCLHIVTDDGNIEQGHVDFCVQQAKDQQHADCLAAAEMLAAMTETQRRKVYATH